MLCLLPSGHYGPQYGSRLGALCFPAISSFFICFLVSCALTLGLWGSSLSFFQTSLIWHRRSRTAAHAHIHDDKKCSSNEKCKAIMHETCKPNIRAHLVQEYHQRCLCWHFNGFVYWAARGEWIRQILRLTRNDRDNLVGHCPVFWPQRQNNLGGATWLLPQSS